MGFFIAILIGAKRWGYKYAAWLSLAAGLWSVFSGALYVVRVGDAYGAKDIIKRPEILSALAQTCVISVLLIHMGYAVGVALNCAYMRLYANAAGKL